jgi:hypothetical protein
MSYDLNFPDLWRRAATYVDNVRAARPPLQSEAPCSTAEIE